MNKDQVKGRVEQAKGSVKETTGKASATELEAEGKVDKAAGKTQATYGDAKEKVKSAVDKADRRGPGAAVVGPTPKRRRPVNSGGVGIARHCRFLRPVLERSGPRERTRAATSTLAPQARRARAPRQRRRFGPTGSKQPCSAGGMKRLSEPYTWRSPRARLLRHVEALRHQQVQVVAGARHRDVEQAALLLDLGGGAGRHVRRDAAVDDVAARTPPSTPGPWPSGSSTGSGSPRRAAAGRLRRWSPPAGRASAR